MLPPGYPSPAQGPLAERGWALQEWRLSLRIIHFTKGGLTWVCKTVQCGERDEFIDVSEYPGWHHLVEDYTSRKLTYETDRRIALEGLVKEMGEGHCRPILSWDLDIKSARASVVDDMFQNSNRGTR
jgi:hypothetical protein